MSDALQAGADRFKGYGDLYDGVRPTPPAELAIVLKAYAGGGSSRVVDLGSGTGLSSRWAAQWADDVIGVEPSEDMRAAADSHGVSNVTYVPGWSHDTGLADASADIVIAVQALHWMEPEPTFREVARLLRPGGVFAAIDCDWPPVVGDVVAEQAWDTCRRQLRVFETRVADGLAASDVRAQIDEADREGAGYSGIDPHRDRRLSGGVRSWSKSGHLDRMTASGRFSWCREVATTSTEEGIADRFIGLLRSQGDYQTLRRHGLEDHELGVDRFESSARERLGEDRRPWRFIYRARLAFSSAAP